MRVRQSGPAMGLLAVVLALSACGGSGGSPSGAAASCASRLPMEVKDYTITVNIPSDSDTFYNASPTANTPAITPTTKIAYSVLLPERCPGELFPLIMQSHGYSGSRITAIKANATIEQTEHFPQIDELVSILPRKGYVVISYDERGHGDSKPANGGGYARTIDPKAEVADARAILDWAYDQSIDGGNGGEQLPLRADKRSGIAKDLRVGTIGLSYGGGFQLQLTALDDRIDTIVPNGTWHSLMYSLLPGDAVKTGFGSLLCVLALGQETTPAVINTPLVATLCNLIGPTNINANNIRTRADLAAAGTAPTNPAVFGNPANQGQASRPFNEQEIVDYFYQHGTAYQKNRQQNNQPLDAGGAAFRLRAVPALFLQGNRDVLFNLTEVYWNAKYFLEAGGSGDVRVLTTEGGHMNPFAGQKQGPANCGRFNGPEAIFAWFDFQLKGINSSAYSGIPKVCISVADTPGSNALTPDFGVTLASFPVGSLSGTGALPATLATGSVAVTPLNVENNPAFVKVADIAADGFVLAGIPSIDSITVAAGTPGSAITPLAFVGVGIVRGGNTILVDQQLTPFVEGTHSNNRNLGESDNTKVLLPGVGEMLRAGDQVGLVFYCAHVHYQAVASTATVSGAGGNGPTAPSEFPGVTLPNATSCINNYSVSFSNAALPILQPGSYAGSAFSQP